ncbi:MAG: outer membrane lipoprotein carrier protein LolA [Oligoflexia bacterium]|nr:outer membrane lipoprotein carrier protein LolA [Oligoflexia bacterium]
MSFTQVNSFTFSKDVKKSSGVLIASVPRKFIWELFGDEASSVVSNGKKIWFYTPPEEDGDRGVLIIKDAQDSEGFLSLLFDCSYEPVVSRVKSKGTVKAFLSGSREKGYDWAVVEYGVNPPRFFSLSFTDFSGNKTSIITNGFMKLKKPVPAASFNFKVPGNARIVN